MKNNMRLDVVTLEHVFVPGVWLFNSFKRVCHLLAECSECCAVKLFAIVYYDFFGYAEAAYNILPKEFLQCGGRDVMKSFSFDPL